MPVTAKVFSGNFKFQFCSFIELVTRSHPLNTSYAYQYVKNRRGIFEYIQGGSVDTKLPDVRVFDEATKKLAYMKQSAIAESKNASNCPLCALGHDDGKNKVWKPAEMDADHVAAWSKGGATSYINCQML